MEVLYFWKIKEVRSLFKQTAGHRILGFHSSMSLDIGLMGSYTM